MEKSLLDLLEEERKLVRDVNAYHVAVSDIKNGELPFSALAKYETKLKNAKSALLVCRKEIATYLKNIKML